MNEKMITFADPDNTFKIRIPAKWKLKKAKKSDPFPLHSFQIARNSKFEITARLIDSTLRKIITSKNWKAHNWDFPNFSFYESFEREEDNECYFWVCPIDDHLIWASYRCSVKNKEIGHNLRSLRMMLQHISYNRKNERPEDCNHFKGAMKSSDYYDIELWRDRPVKFYEFMANLDRTKIDRISPLEVDPIKLYTLLRLKISNQPNGHYTLVAARKPLDNMIWWDFIIECNKGFIQVWRTPHILEAICLFDGPFDVTKFFNNSIRKNINAIKKEIESYDKHTVYINHYRSYKDCVIALWKDITAIDLTPPKSPPKHIVPKSEMDEYAKGIRVFIDNSVKFHTLGKSLVLNAAFEIESFLNLIIRVGASSELKTYPDILDKFLRSDFMNRIRNMTFYSNILSQNVDSKHQAVKDANELMILRNKYVHFEEDTAHNKIGEILFDGDFPLHPILNDRPGVESFRQIFHKPDFKTVKKAYETASSFVAYIESLFSPLEKDRLVFLLNENPISYNEKLGAYSSVYQSMVIDFFSVNDAQEGTSAT